MNAPPRRARHLIDPTAPRAPYDPEAARRLARVQQWVLSTLAVTTILHLSAGFIVAAVFVPETHLVARIGLNVVAGAFGTIAVAAGLAIHKRNPVSGWLVLGLVPLVVGLAITFGR